MRLARALAALGVAIAVAGTAPFVDGRQPKKPKKPPATVHGVVAAVQPPVPGGGPGFLVVTVAGKKKAIAKK